MAKNDSVSLSVVKRLPRYYRFLGEIKKNGTVRISSGELSKKNGVLPLHKFARILIASVASVSKDTDIMSNSCTKK